MIIVKFLMSIFVMILGSKMVIFLFGVANDWFENLRDEAEIKREIRRQEKIERMYPNYTVDDRGR